MMMPAAFYHDTMVPRLVVLVGTAPDIALDYI